MEKKVDHKLPFLDICINNSNVSLTKTTVYRKKTFVGLFTSFLKSRGRVSFTLVYNFFFPSGCVTTIKTNGSILSYIIDEELNGHLALEKTRP